MDGLNNVMRDNPYMPFDKRNLSRPKGGKGKPPKKKTIHQLKKQAWDLHSKFVRMEEGQCYTCGWKSDRWQDLDAGHFKHKKSMNLIRKNIHAQCTTCNRWKHGNHSVYAYKLIKQYGPKVVEELTIMSNKTKIFTRDELIEFIEKHKKLIIDLEGK